MTATSQPGPSWDDPCLAIASDSQRRARYRRLQSWYRHTILDLPAGENQDHRPVGSLLPAAAIKQDPSLNFLQDRDLAHIASARLDERRGAMEPDRLMRNLLSSEPMCINLFGVLKLHLDDAGAVLREATGLPIRSVTRIDIEESPAGATEILADRTAFDAYVEYRSDDDEPCFLGVETKYTEPFSHDRGLSATKREKYQRLAADFGVFHVPLSPALLGTKASQLFRNLLLALAHSRTAGTRGHVLVVALDADPDAAAGVRIVREQLLAPDEHLLAVSIESIVAAAKSPTLLPWAAKFRQRYLDLEPVLG